MKTKGNWVIKTSTGLYWCGQNLFDEQIRKAQIYHWKEKAEEQAASIWRRSHISEEVSWEIVAVIPPQEQKEIEAEWIVSYLDGERNYVCSHCGYYALYDIGDQAFDSHFCPHCGRRMLNSTQPWTERCI